MSEEIKPVSKARGRGKTRNKKAPVEETPVVTETPVVDEAPVEDVPAVEETPAEVNTPIVEVGVPVIMEEQIPEVIPDNHVGTLDKDSVAYIEKTIKDATTVDAIFEGLSGSAMVSSIVNKLKTYRARMIAPHTEVQGVNQQYYMYNIMLEILNETNYGVFNVKFRLLNKVIALGKDGVFSRIKLSRYDYHWKWGVKTHETYFKLVSIIDTLSDGSKRSINLKTIDFNKGIDNLTSTAKQNLIRFYK